ncbi:MAG: sulfate/molybdate ABC transporter ATP-binding protein, partial [Bacilli bacterium]
PDSGSVFFDEKDVTGQGIGERGVGFVFQHYALFRHMTVFDNIAFGLTVMPKQNRPSKETIDKEVNQLLHLIKLEHIKDRFPHQLSGGQRQRVALARALAVKPQVLLLDEPFGALDAKVRKSLRRWLRELHAELGMTTIFVTHDQEEALDVANRIVILNEGKIEQIGTPQEVYDVPNSAFVYDFLGNVNLFHGRIQGGKLILNDKEALSIGDDQTAATDSEKAIGFVRAHDLHIYKREEADDSCLQVQVKHIQMLGPVVKLELYAKENELFLEAEVTRERYRELNVEVNQSVWVKPYECRVFVPEDFSI